MAGCEKARFAILHPRDLRLNPHKMLTSHIFDLADNTFAY